MKDEDDFEELEIYKLAREIRKKFYRLARALPEEEKYLLTLNLKCSMDQGH